LNDADGVVDTNPFNNDVMVLPVATAALTSMSKKAKSGNIQYWVAAGTMSSGLTDVSSTKASFNVLKPGLAIVNGPALTGIAAENFSGEQFFADIASSSQVKTLTVLREPTYANQQGKGLLLLHPDNLPGERVQVVPIAKVATSVKVTATSSAHPLTVGAWLEVTATVKPALGGIGAPAGTVTFYDNGKLISQRVLNRYGVTKMSTKSLTKGVHVIGVRYGGNPADWLTSKATYRVVVS
jgi:hypothetical protein